ncbi:MAG: CPBP family intramembrane glutamic endopeptidase [Chloroflexota bacterium]
MSSPSKDKAIIAMIIALSAIAPVILIPLVGGGAYIGIQALRGIPIEQSMEQFRSFMTIAEANAMTMTYVMMGLFLLQKYKTAVAEAWKKDESKARFALRGFALGFAVFCLNTFVMWILLEIRVLGRDTLFIKDDHPLVITIIYMCIFIIMAPITEELFFRYLVQNWLKKYNLVLGLLVPSILNALLHLENNSILLIPFTLTFFCYAFAYHRSDKITIPIAAHMVTNTLLIGTSFLLG